MSKVTSGPVAPAVPPQDQVPTTNVSGEDVVTPGVKPDTPATLTAATKTALDAFSKQAATIDWSKESLEDFHKRMDEIDKNWPYDTRLPMTDAQLKEQGAIDVTDSNKGLGIIIGHK